MAIFTPISNSTSTFTTFAYVQPWENGFKRSAINSRIIAKINNLIQDTRLVENSFVQNLESIVEVLNTSQVDEQTFLKIKALLRPIISKFKDMETDEAEYLLDESKEIILILSKNLVKAAPKETLMAF